MDNNDFTLMVKKLKKEKYQKKIYFCSPKKMAWGILPL